LRSISHQDHQDVIVGIGDDAAIVKPQGQQSLVQTIDYISLS